MAEQRAAVTADWTRCRGCQICQLACSFRRAQVFNPSEAAIQVRWLGGETEFHGHFTSDCDRCGTCVRYCLYGTLSREGGGEEATATAFEEERGGVLGHEA